MICCGCTIVKRQRGTISKPVVINQRILTIPATSAPSERVFFTVRRYATLIDPEMTLDGNALRCITHMCFGANHYKKLSYCWETVRRESMPRIAEVDVEMTT